MLDESHRLQIEFLDMAGFFLCGFQSLVFTISSDGQDAQVHCAACTSLVNVAQARHSYSLPSRDVHGFHETGVSCRTGLQDAD